MACTVTIASVTGVLPPGGTVPTGIVVTGTSTECVTGLIKVTVDCGTSPMTMTVPVDAMGGWVATFGSASVCQCGKPISVRASCSDGGCESTLDTVLQCEAAQGCPSLGSFTVSVDGCSDGMGVNATAVFTLTLVPPTSGCTYVWRFGDGSPNLTTSVPTVTHVYTAPGTFSATVVATCPPVGGVRCEVRAQVDVVVPPCSTECPTVVGLTATVSGCAGPSSATVLLNGTLTPPLTGCSFLWAFGVGPNQITTSPSVSHVYTAPGTYAVSVTPICPGIVPCSTTTIVVTVPRCCPIVTNIVANLEDNECADGMGKSATMIFSAITDPATAAGNYTWNFGDGSPAVTNPGANATHDYASAGTFTVQVIYTPNPAMYPGCSPSVFSISVTVPACSGGGGDGGGNDGGETGGCFGLRVIMTIAAILAIVSVSLAACIPAAAPALFWVALGFAILAALAGLVWNYLCPKPCGWGLLLAWQVSLGVGFVLLYFTLCCPVFWPIGLALVAGGIALMLVWKQRCHKNKCAVLKELVVALSGVLLPLLGWLGVIPPLAACINPWVAGVLSTLAAAAALAAASCVP